MVNDSCLWTAVLSVQVNVYELLADLLESSEVDCLDNEDPIRMRTSAQAKLAEITEVQNSAYSHKRIWMVMNTATLRQALLGVFTSRSPHMDLPTWMLLKTENGQSDPQMLNLLYSTKSIHVMVHPCSSILHRCKQQLQKPGAQQLPTCTIMWMPAA